MRETSGVLQVPHMREHLEPMPSCLPDGGSPDFRRELRQPAAIVVYPHFHHVHAHLRERVDISGCLSGVGNF